MRTPKTLRSKAEAALKEAVKEVIENHKRSGMPLAIWRNGKVMWISASRILRKSR